MPRPKEFDEEAALLKATQVFRRNGYHNSSMQELVTETGVCRASLYETYGDKHALYLKALDHHRQLTKEAIEQAVAAGGTAESRLRAIYELVVSPFGDPADTAGCFMTNAMLEMLPAYNQSVGPVVNQNLNGLEATFATVLREGIASGEFCADLPLAATTRFLLGVVGGLNVIGKARPNVAALNEVVEMALRVLR